MNSRFASICLLAVNVLIMSATDEQPRPREPLLPAMPQQAAWVLEFSEPAGTTEETPGGDGSRALSPSNRITIAKDGPVYRVMSEKSVNGYREAWVVGGRMFLIMPDASRCALADISLFPGTDFSHGDFEYFQWLQSGNCIGMAEFEGRKTFVFETDSLKHLMSARDSSAVSNARQALHEDALSMEKGSSPKEAADGEVLHQLGWGATFRAWIDAVSQRPLCFESGGLRIRVRYIPFPGPLTLPPSVLQRLKEIGEEQRRLQKRSSHPKP